MVLSGVFSERRLRLLVVLFAWSVLCPVGVADTIEPGPRDRLTAQAVALLASRQHLLQHPLDDEVSQRCLELFLRRLDPWKIYFNQSDVDRFMSHKDDLDDQVRSGDTQFAYTVFNTLLERIDQRTELAEELLAVEHDFSVDEEMVADRKLARYASNEAEARERWRKLVKYDFLPLKAEGVEGEEAVEKLRRRYRSRSWRMHRTESGEILEIYLTAFVKALDPHSGFMSPSSAEDFDIRIGGKLEGIGALLGWVDGETIIQRVIPGGAVEKDGRLKVGDRIVGVGQGENGEIEDATDMTLRDVVKRIRGKPGTLVRLQITSPDNPKRRIIDIRRARIELQESKARFMVFEEGRKPDGKPYKIGVIDLGGFYKDKDAALRGVPDYTSATRDVRRILTDFEKEHVDAVVLDLRRNGGGYLDEAVAMTGLFIDQGPMVQVRNPGGAVYQHPDPEPGTVWNGPLVVLVSKVSASASEILAGAIQDYRRGLIVGDRATHGKGTVQVPVDLSERLFPYNRSAPEYGTLRITIQQYFRANGESTQIRGVEADVELPSLTAQLADGETDLDHPIPFDRVDPLNFEKLDEVDQAVCDRLKQRSARRVRESESFQEVRRKIALLVAEEERKRVSLNEKKFMARRAELTPDDQEDPEAPDPKPPAIQRDDYLGEVFAITLDYLELKEQT